MYIIYIYIYIYIYNVYVKFYYKIMWFCQDFLNLYSFYAVRILDVDLSIEVMLNPTKIGMKHLYKPKDFYFMLEQVYFHFLEAKFINVF